MDRHLRAGIALYNDGQYGVARTLWARADPAGGADERLLTGLRCLTAAAEWGEETALLQAREHLGAVPEDHRGVDLAAIRAATREGPAVGTLRHRGAALAPEMLSFRDTAVAARAVAAHDERFDPAVIDDAAEYAAAAVEADDTNRFVTFLFDFVGDPDARPTVYERLRDHVARRRRRVEDVDGLF